MLCGVFLFDLDVMCFRVAACDQTTGSLCSLNLFRLHNSRSEQLSYLASLSDQLLGQEWRLTGVLGMAFKWSSEYERSLGELRIPVDWLSVYELSIGRLKRRSLENVGQLAKRVRVLNWQSGTAIKWLSECGRSVCRPGLAINWLSECAINWCAGNEQA